MFFELIYNRSLDEQSTQQLMNCLALQYAAL